MFFTIAALFMAILLESYRRFLFNGFPFQYPSEFNSYFSDDYYEARQKFRDAVKQNPMGMELHSIAMDINDKQLNEDESLTIDIAVLRRSQSKVLIHISGTHGVEGFTGSAIQNFIIEKGISSSSFLDDHTPTLVFVHALNAYGFAKLRRFNENNVDLNRNFLTEDQFKEMIDQDPNHSGYVDMMDLINPTKSLKNKLDFFWFRAIYNIARHGYKSLKQSLVTGNYHFPKTLFYGGNELQQSHSLLKDFLLSHFDIENMEKVGIIDVHTGLGPSGFDTIQMEGTSNNEECKSIFGGHQAEFSHHIYVGNDDNNDGALSGYSKVVGMLPYGLSEQIFSSNVKVFAATQEFGTIPGVLVFKAMRAENTMYHYDSTNRSPKYTNDLRDAFYLKNNNRWKDKVVTRGDIVFNQLYSHLLLT